MSTTHAAPAAAATGDPPPPETPQNPPPTPAATPDPPAATAAPPPVAAVDLDDDDRAHGVVADGDRVAVPASSFKKVKEKAEGRGRQKALAETTERAKALGFDSVDAMFLALAARKEEPPMTTTPPVQNPITPPAAAAAAAPITPPAAVTPPPAAAREPEPEPGELPENDRRYSAAQRARLRQARIEMNTKVETERKQREAAELSAQSAATQLEVFKAEQTMREDLIREGCTEIDFAFTKLREHLKALSDDKTPEGKEKFEKFDIKVWAADRKKLQPFLFGTVNTPATTGTNPNHAPPQPGPTQVQQGAAAAGAKNAKNMTDKEWAEYKRANGINA